MRGILVFLVAIGSTGTLAGQEATPVATIRLLVESESGPIAGAQVMAGEISAVTDQNGVATIMANAGNIDVSVSREGFIANKTSITVAAGQTQDVVLELQPNPTAKQKITCSATRTDMLLDYFPLLLQVIHH